MDHHKANLETAPTLIAFNVVCLVVGIALMWFEDLMGGSVVAGISLMWILYWLWRQTK